MSYAEPNKEVPEKRVVLDPLLKPSQLEEKTPKPEQKNGLFKKSELKTTEDYQKVCNNLSNSTNSNCFTSIDIAKT